MLLVDCAPSWLRFQSRAGRRDLKWVTASYVREEWILSLSNIGARAFVHEFAFLDNENLVCNLNRKTQDLLRHDD